ncbi:MAG TPA: RelA/SpoT family protein [Bacilli bacterium]|nr:RelA/SpoT family protein [Bacilli bacterium]
MKKEITKIDDLLKVCESYIQDKEELNNIEDAYLYAKLHHEGMKRKSNTPYIYHPLNVAYILADLNVDSKTIVGALLHETINHGTGSLEEIEKKFGTDIAKIVNSISKINKLELNDDSESSSIYLRKILVGLSEDVRVLFIKLADRLHNMRTIWALSPEKQKQKANETAKVLIPIAHRLGINKIKSELEDWCLKYLKPDVYNDILEKLNDSREDLNIILNEMKESVSNILKDYGLKFEIKGRVKSINSIYEKLNKGKKFNDIYDILALRIILPKESDCYLAVGLIHAKYRPMPKRFKDYIASPKENMYQSIHTTVFGTDGYLFEIQLRTPEMDEIAEKGIASHWSYKEVGTKKIQNLMEQKLELFRSIIESNADFLSDPDFAENVSKEFINDLIYVYTPKGDVVELPKGSTPIDFAYRIHSDIGDKIVGCLVNDGIANLDSELHDGDIVKVKTSNDAKPRRAWLKIVKTSGAKNRIKAYFSKQDRNLYIESGKSILDKEIKKRKLSNNDILNEENLTKIFKYLKIKDLDDLYLGLGTLKYLPGHIIDLNNQNKKDIDPLINTSIRQVKKETYNGDIIVCGIDNIKVSIANCCKPIKGDKIVGYITKDRGVSIHRQDCPNISLTDDRVVDVCWNNNHECYYYTDLLIETDSFNDNLMDILNKSGQKDIHIESVNKKETTMGINYLLNVKIKNLKDLDLFIKDLEKLKYIKKVSRRNN